MNVNDTLKLISKQWCTLEDLMALLGCGRNKALEVKKDISEMSKNSSSIRNQRFYIRKLNDMSFARFIYPQNEEEVLYELQQAFRS